MRLPRDFLWKIPGRLLFGGECFAAVFRIPLNIAQKRCLLEFVWPRCYNKSVCKLKFGGKAIL